MLFDFMTTSIFCFYSIVKQLCFDDGSPEENRKDLITIQVCYCGENEGWTFKHV